ncbi:MAG: hypothetical protein NTW67_06710 [Candidatus Woesearchaeota archaeon]|nr:hypothetical protein [Candidatus Woesearchaeota archaeon]
MRSTVFYLLQDLDIINQAVYEHAGMYLFVKERKRLGKHKFENVFRMQSELTFIEAGRVVLVKCEST